MRGFAAGPTPAARSKSLSDDDDAPIEDGASRREADYAFQLPARLARVVLPPHDTEESQRLQEIAALHHADARDNAPPLRATTARTQAKELAATKGARRTGAGVAASRVWLAGLARAHAHHGRGRGAGH